jgi:hypothetical protein
VSGSRGTRAGSGVRATSPTSRGVPFAPRSGPLDSSPTRRPRPRSIACLGNPRDNFDSRHAYSTRRRPYSTTAGYCPRSGAALWAPIRQWCVQSCLFFGAE